MPDTELFKVFCPHCKAEINYLNYKIVKEYEGTIDCNGDVEDTNDDPYCINNFTYTVYCPECDKEIKGIDCDDEAVAFLNNEEDE